ncbi:hypothetical protein [Nocardia panacis]|uniref:hypothetical protein n=1 Tax=Nocardia panacis TaxID=2340916 RepID=UPI0026AC581C
MLHRITGAYALLGLAVPVVGIILAAVQDRIGEIWIIVAIGLTTIAGGLIALFIHPMQRDALATPDAGERLRSLAMFAGIYNVLWLVVTVLMIVRPGSHL